MIDLEDLRRGIKARKKSTEITMLFESDRATFRARKNPSALYRGKPRGRCWIALERQDGAAWTRVRTKNGRLSHLTLPEILRTVGGRV